MKILLFGGTGLLGRHIVLKALKSGYEIRCVVRNLSKAKFLREWGAEIVYGDLTKFETIPATLKDIDIVIDASTSAGNNAADVITPSAIKEIDWTAKKNLLKLMELAEIRHFIFFSLLTSSNYDHLFYLRVKRGIENLLIASNLEYTVFKIDAFLQVLINQFAIPILENEKIWTINESRPLFYIDSADAATFCIESLRSKAAKNQTIPLIDVKPWFATDIIKLCETLSGQSAQVSDLPGNFLKIYTFLLNKFKWAWGNFEYLSFREIFEFGKTIERQDLKTELFVLKVPQLVQLDSYLKDFFKNILLTLKDITYQQQQKQKDILF